MRISVKLTVLWTLGLAVFLGSPAATRALPTFVAGKTYCVCACSGTVGGHFQNVQLQWEKVGSCSLANSKGCKGTFGGQTYSGKLNDCQECKSQAEDECGGYGAIKPGAVVQPGAML